MESIIFAINTSWWWLGPWLLVSLGVALVALISEIVVEEVQGSEVQRFNG